jgi:hypothetical protein
MMDRRMATFMYVKVAQIYNRVGEECVTLAADTPNIRFVLIRLSATLP